MSNRADSAFAKFGFSNWKRTACQLCHLKPKYIDRKSNILGDLGTCDDSEELLAQFGARQK